MPTPPTRPVDGAEIATEWGQAVHDGVFAPHGVEVSGADVSQLAGSLTLRTLPLDTAVDDPGGWLDAPNDRLVVPADHGGQYLCLAWVRTDEGAATDETRAFLYVNGAEVARQTVGQEGAAAIPCKIVDLVSLTAGDLIQVKTYQIGTGTRATVGVVSLKLMWQGHELGA